MPSAIELESDVVIVGGGIAGCVAAARAREAGADVLVVDKARSIRRSGDAGHGLGFVTTFLDSGPDDTAETFTDWYMRVADQLVPRPVVTKIAVEPMHEAFAYADSLGLSIRDPATGGYRRVERGYVGTGGPRIVQFPGDDVKPILAGAAERAGARIEGGIHVTAVLLDGDGRAAGVAGVGVRDGVFRVIRAPSVILGAGSSERVMQTPTRNPFNTYHRPWHGATPFALAARAGAESVNIEFLSSFLMPRGFPNGGQGNLAEAGARRINAFGQEYENVPDQPGERSFGVSTVRAGVREILAGRGPLFIDSTVLPEEKLKEVLTFIHLDGPAFMGFIEQSGLDLRKDLLEVELFVSVWSATGSPKGVLVDERCMTRVPGLFSIGDMATPSYSFAGAITTGYIAGREAAAEARAAGDVKPSEAHVEAERDRVLAPMSREGDIGWFEYEAQAQETMARYMHIARDRMGMERGAAHLERIAENGDRVAASNPHELMRTLEGQDIVMFSRMMVAAALARQESRFNYLIGHFRTDFPDPDDENWKGVANVVTWADGGPQVEQRLMNPL